MQAAKKGGNCDPSQVGAKKARKPSLLAQNLKAAHKRMSRTLGYCLHLDEPERWQDCAALAAVHLTKRELAAAAWAFLRGLPAKDREDVAATALGASGDPLPAFLGGMDDARHWASVASPAELKAYALAAYEALPVADQNKFRWHIGSDEVAV